MIAGRFSSTAVHANSPDVLAPTAAVLNTEGLGEWIVVRIEPATVESIAWEDERVVARLTLSTKPTVSVHLSIAHAKALHRMLACCLAKPGEVCPACDGKANDEGRDCYDCAGTGIVQTVEGERDTDAGTYRTKEDFIARVTAA